MATSSAGFRAGDVVVVPFPYTDRFAEKRRPALVVSNSAVGSLGYVWVVMITSARHARNRHDLLIADLKPTGLDAPSLVRPIKIACIEPSRIIRKVGVLSRGEVELACATIQSFIGLRSRLKE